MLSRIIIATALVVAPGIASAADLAARYQPFKAPPSTVQPFSWTGFYAGLNVGGAFDNSDRVDVFGLPTLVGATPDPIFLRNKSDGVTAGGQLGYNYQFSTGYGQGIVLGFETDISYTDLKHDMLIDGGAALPGGTVDFHSRMNYLGTIRGRLGYAYDRLLVYGTGGFAYGQIEHSAVATVGGIPVFNASLQDTETGFVVGGGIEYALPVDPFYHYSSSSAVTVRAEYLHYERENTSASFNAITLPPVAINLKDTGNIVRAGINYKF
jgi:outer membrane immunogenic protein